MKIIWRNFIDTLMLIVIPMSKKFYNVVYVDNQLDLFNDRLCGSLWYLSNSQVETMISNPLSWNSDFQKLQKYPYYE